MKVTIKGLTLSTLALTHTKITLRGDSSLPKQYPESIARSISVNNMDQAIELRNLRSSKLISLELVEEDNSSLQIMLFPETIRKQEPEVKIVEKDSTVSKKIEVKTATKAETKPKTIKRSKKAGVSPKSEQPDEDSVVVVTEDGIKRGNTIKEEDKIGDLDDSDRTSASIKALEQIEAEDARDLLESEEANAQRSKVNESKLDPSERMGGKAFIGMGKNSKGVTMKSSIIEEANEIKERDPFIAKDVLSTEDKSLDSFIENDWADDDDDKLIEC